MEIIQAGKTRNGFPLGQFMIRESLVRVKTGKSLGIVYKIRIPRKIIDKPTSVNIRHHFHGYGILKFQYKQEQPSFAQKCTLRLVKLFRHQYL